MIVSINATLYVMDCPECNANQEFPTHYRKIDVLGHWYESYLRCTMCRWERRVDVITAHEVGKRRKNERLKRRRERQE